MRGMMRRAGGAVAALVVAGCAANPGSAGMDGAAGGDAFVHVVVENERAVLHFLHVSLVPPAGAPISLGTTSTLGTDTLVARGPLPPGRYTLRATGGRNVRMPDQNVMLRGGETLYWNLRNHLLRQDDP
jgi:hypothetical protein